LTAIKIESWKNFYMLERVKHQPFVCVALGSSHKLGSLKWQEKKNWQGMSSCLDNISQNLM
jgi:hypothetical protein